MRSQTDRPLDIPDADAAEQSRELRPPAAGPRPTGEARRHDEADDFDVVEQSIVVEHEDEEEYR